VERPWAAAWRFVPPNVWFLGATSLLTDLSSEMVVSVLPLYLVVQLGFSPLAFGALDGLYNGIGALTRLGSGIAVDRWGKPKGLAAAGYGVSALCRLGLLAAGRWWPGIAAAIVVDRLGKGIRAVPRDALIAQSTPHARLGYAFGVHRALDACGAALGPVAAFAILAAAPRGFDVIFVASFFAALVGLGVLVLFVENVAPAAAADTTAWNGPRVIDFLRDVTLRRVVVPATALALATISDAFVYLILLERLGFSPGLFPLLYVGTSLSYLALAIPAGALADRWGRWRVFLCGYVALLGVYSVLWSGLGGPVTVLLAVGLLGAYYAATDGVVIAFASGVLAESQRGTGLAVLTTCTSVARLLSSVAFGWVWVLAGRDGAVAAFAVALTVALAASFSLRRPQGVHGD
jgi:MFS family permease